jgi:DNA-nicking Smr family endonuclease
MAGRPLSPGEQALWQRVAASVRALQRGVPKPPGDRPVAALPPPPRQAPPPPPPPGKAPVIGTAARANTLDGGWDRRLAAGQVAPERTIDLHGCTLAQAHRRLNHALDGAVADGVRVILLITGRAPRVATSRLDLPQRGIIRASIADWLSVSPHAASIAAVRPAHARHGGAGALYVILRRVRN